MLPDGTLPGTPAGADLFRPTFGFFALIPKLELGNEQKQRHSGHGCRNPVTGT